MNHWKPIGLLAAVLFLINVVVRLVVRIGWSGNATAESRASLTMFVLIAVVLGVLAFQRSRRRPVAEWLPEMAASTGIAMLFTVLVGPFISGDAPFDTGAGDFFLQIWLYLGCAGSGILIGYLLATTLGLDYRSQGLKRYAQEKLTKPRRAVRR